MKDEYYTGPGGVFYDPRDNNICILEKTDEGVLTDNYKIKAAFYNFYHRGIKHKRVLLEGIMEWVRIGDF